MSLKKKVKIIKTKVVCLKKLEGGGANTPLCPISALGQKNQDFVCVLLPSLLFLHWSKESYGLIFEVRSVRRDIPEPRFGWRSQVRRIYRRNYTGPSHSLYSKPFSFYHISSFLIRFYSFFFPLSVVCTHLKI